MKYSQAQYGRIFVVRLEDGDIIHEQVETLALKEGIQNGVLFILGGANKKSRIMVGPENGEDIKQDMPIMSRVFQNVHESLGIGTIFPGESGNPVLHLHLSCGRGDNTITGCTRSGVVTWRYMEAVILELAECKSRRVLDPETNFYMLEP